MKRIPAVMAAVAASAALATTAIGAAGALPAFAAPNPHAGHAKTVQHQIASLKAAKPAQAAKLAGPAKSADPVKILSQYNSGQYVTVVTCQGADTPGPVRVNQPHMPLHVSGDALTPATISALARPRAYKKVYSCAVTVEKRLPVATGKGGGTKCELPGGRLPGAGGSAGQEAGACRHRVTLNTGLGGQARSVAQHHPVH
jgi:hypothetical protein